MWLLVFLAVALSCDYYCDGVPDDVPHVCCGHGSCVDTDTCECDFGWTGPFCCDEVPDPEPGDCELAPPDIHYPLQKTPTSGSCRDYYGVPSRPYVRQCYSDGARIYDPANRYVKDLLIDYTGNSTLMLWLRRGNSNSEKLKSLILNFRDSSGEPQISLRFTFGSSYAHPECNPVLGLPFFLELLSVHDPGITLLSTVECMYHYADIEVFSSLAFAGDAFYYNGTLVGRAQELLDIGDIKRIDSDDGPGCDDDDRRRDGGGSSCKSLDIRLARLSFWRRELSELGVLKAHSVGAYKMPFVWPSVECEPHVCGENATCHACEPEIVVVNNTVLVYVNRTVVQNVSVPCEPEVVVVNNTVIVVVNNTIVKNVSIPCGPPEVVMRNETVTIIEEEYVNNTVFLTVSVNLTEVCPVCNKSEECPQCPQACEPPNYCCENGWRTSVLPCDTPTCVPECAPHGVCVDVDTCNCTDGWTGEDCKTPENCTYSPCPLPGGLSPYVYYPLTTSGGFTCTDVHSTSIPAPLMPPSLGMPCGPPGLSMPLTQRQLAPIYPLPPATTGFVMSFWVWPNVFATGVGTIVLAFSGVPFIVDTTAGTVQVFPDPPIPIPVGPPSYHFALSGVLNAPGSVTLWIDGNMVGPLPSVVMTTGCGDLLLDATVPSWYLSGYYCDDALYSTAMVQQIYSLGHLAPIGKAPHACYGRSCGDPLVCGGHGNCVAEDVCDCCAGYTGEECACMPEMVTIVKNITVKEFEDCTGNCSGHGECGRTNEGREICDCDEGWYPPDCSRNRTDICQNFTGPCEPEVIVVNNTVLIYVNKTIVRNITITRECTRECNQGDCATTNSGDEVCKCDPFWRGENCTKWFCDPCCENGECVGPGECLCDPYWSGPLCNESTCVFTPCNASAIPFQHWEFYDPTSGNCDGVSSHLLPLPSPPDTRFGVCTSDGLVITEAEFFSGFLFSSFGNSESYTVWMVIDPQTVPSTHAIKWEFGNAVPLTEYEILFTLTSSGSCTGDTPYLLTPVESGWTPSCVGTSILASLIRADAEGRIYFTFGETMTYKPLPIHSLQDLTAVVSGTAGLHGFTRIPTGMEVSLIPTVLGHGPYNGFPLFAFSCFGVECNDETVCSGHGNCVGADTCECCPGWSGEDCSVPDTTCNCTNCTCPPREVAILNKTVTILETIVEEETIFVTVWVNKTEICDPCNGTNTTCTTCEECEECEVCEECEEFPTCYDIVPWHPTVCRGHGQCHAQDTCLCDPGWWGAQCNHGGPDCECDNNCRGICEWDECSEEWKFMCKDKDFYGTCCEDTIHYCNGTVETDESVCSGKGDCAFTDVCICNAFWEGPWCDEPYCDPSCENGDCVEGNQCECHTGWTGRRCDVPICDPDCVNGFCYEPGGCICHQGWKGDRCHKPICNPSCGDHGGCIAPDYCDCDDGWKGDFCDHEHGHCSPRQANDTNCPTGQVCVVVNGVPSCWCPDCYHPWKCNGVPADRNHTCSGHGDCISENECECDEGWMGTVCDRKSVV